MPASPPSPERRLIVIWVVWPSYLPPLKAVADCHLGGCVILSPPSLDAAACHLGGVAAVSPPSPKAAAYCGLGGCALLYSLARRMIVVWVVVPSPPSPDTAADCCLVVRSCPPSEQ